MSKNKFWEKSSVWISINKSLTLNFSYAIIPKENLMIANDTRSALGT